MPSEDQKSKKDSPTKILLLVAGFLLVSLVVILFYYQKTGTKTNDNTSSNSSNSSSNSDSWATYTSSTHGYSISYPKDWVKTNTSTTSESSGLEIILLNVGDNESRENGKPNIIITAGAPSDFCKDLDPNECKALSTTIFASTKANGEQETINKVLETFKLN